jgi:hypothetical protein
VLASFPAAAVLVATLPSAAVLVVAMLPSAAVSMC